MTVFCTLLLTLIFGTGEEADLRTRIDEFFRTSTEGSMIQALEYVESDSQDRFLQEWSRATTRYEIGEVEIEGDRAKAVVRVDRRIPPTATVIMFPLQTEWVRIDQKWYLEIPEREFIETAFGKVRLGPNDTIDINTLKGPTGTVEQDPRLIEQVILSHMHERLVREREALEAQQSEAAGSPGPGKTR